MPEAVALLGATILEAAVAGTEVGALSGSVSIFGLSATASASLVGNIVVVGASVGLQLALAAGAAKSLDKPEITIRQANPGRWISIGREKTGGVLTFTDISTTAGFLTLVVVKAFSCCPIQEIEAVYLNDKIPTFPGQSVMNQSHGTVGNDTWAGLIIVETGRGLPGEVSSPIMQGYFPGLWQAQHVARNLAYGVIAYVQADTLLHQSQKFPNGAPSLSAVIKGGGLPDPRIPSHDLTNEATWAYSDNSALAILRFCVDQDGWGLAPTDLDLDSFAVAATDCDDTMAPGEPRYRSWGRWNTTDPRKQSLEDLLAACDGKLLEQPDGRAKLVVGKYRAPTITITAEDILDIQVSPFGDTLDRVGSVKPRITSEGANWQEIEVGPVTLASPDADQALKELDLPLKFCPSIGQAGRLGQAALRRLNPKWRLTVTTRLLGMQAFGERFIRLVVNTAGLAIDQTFELTAPVAFNMGSLQPTLQLRSVETDDWG